MSAHEDDDCCSRDDFVGFEVLVDGIKQNISHADTDKIAELQCADCHEWFPFSKWRNTWVPCDSCGDHTAIACPGEKCWGVVDYVFGHFEGIKYEDQSPA